VRQQVIAAFALTLVAVLAQSASAQDSSKGIGTFNEPTTIGSLTPPPPQGANRPAPRWPDGRIKLSAPTGEEGIWQPNGRPILSEPETDPAIKDVQGRGAFSGPPFPGKPKESEVPWQPWTRALYKFREANLFEPHTRCKPSGGPRQFITPGGVEFIDVPDHPAIYVIDQAGPYTFRTIYVDGRQHPPNLEPTYYGHSIGRWEGDTLVVDTIGFNERFWFERQGSPHTDQLHLIERFTRVDLNSLKIELTIDDPGAYTRTWTTGFFMRWTPGDQTETLEYICQQNNRADELMIGREEDVERTSPIVP
jgi:hypothetical protein